MATSTDLNAAIDEVQGSLNAGAQEEGLLAPEKGWVDALQERVGALPWWVISVIVHAILLFLFITFFTVPQLVAAADDFFVQSEFLEPEEDDEVDMEAPRDLFKSLVDAPAEIETEQPILPHDDPDAEISDHFETDNDMDMATARGDENALSTVPLGGTGVIGTIGVGGGGAAGVYGFRNGGGRRKCIMKFGGSRASESAVEAALKWLADHQEPDGSWTGLKEHGKHCHGGAGEAPFGNAVDTGLTGLATLAFLGAGYTHKTGKYRETVDKGLQWMISKQNMAEDDEKHCGEIHIRKGEHKGGPGWTFLKGGYGHAIAGLALAEGYGMTKDEKLLKHAQAAVDHSVNARQKPYSGWRYRARETADLSITGWYVMQLKSAKVAGLAVDGKGFQGALSFVDEVTDKEGRSGYLYSRPGRSGVSPCMTSVGMVSRVFMGAKNEDPMLQGGAKYLLEWLPNWEGKYDKPAPGHKGFYYWYYGTLGMFQTGGDAWRQWNGAVRDMLVKNQCTAERGPDLNGSWDPRIAQESRVFATAVGALCLEVYYRYLPMYGE